MKNPFEYSTPEAISAKDIVELFVPVFTAYFNVPNVGHTFVNGARGSGKSMMFRYMSPDCQCIALEKKIVDLDYFAIHIPIKEGHLAKGDLTLIKNKHGEALLNEHFMVINFAIKIFNILSETDFEESNESLEALKKFYSDTFITVLSHSNWKSLPSLPEHIQNIKDIFRFIKEVCSEISRSFTTEFLYQLICTEGPMPYRGAICTFSDFLYPILEKIKALPFMPNKPIYLLIDDADNLTEIQTKILNTWVSLRTSKIISFKISTQLNYSTYRTVNNSRIDTPHDYAEINILDIYTSKKGLYRERVKDAVERRLKKFGYSEISAEDFFPVDKEQEAKIETIFNEYKSKFEKKKGYDYAYRYARSDFMKSLKGNMNTYSYAGFENLVHISSGVMRHLIDFANRMYSHQVIKSSGSSFKSIDPGIQDEEIKAYSNWFFDDNFSKLREDSTNTSEDINDYDKLRNLIEAMGQIFNLTLLSEASERRVFSFALQNDPNEELRRILKLGVQTGYFQKSLIGNKRGTGKSQLYILNRLLAPHFKLDPSSFAGYKFVTCEFLNEALYKPNKVIGRVKNKGIENDLKDPQMLLFDEE